MAEHGSGTRLRYIYFTASFAGSGALLRGLVHNCKNGELIAVVLSRRPRGTFASKILKRSGVRYLIFLTLIGALHVPTQRVLHILAKLSGLENNALDIRATARRLGVPVFEVADIQKDLRLYRLMAGIEPDLFISIFFDQRLPGSWLELPHLCAVNLHNSLLPAFRGPAPTVAALSRGERAVGVSLHVMNEDFDSGPVIEQAVLDVTPKMSVLEIDRKLMELGMKILSRRLDQPTCMSGSSMVQDNRSTSYYTHPDRRDLRNLRARGYRLWTVYEYIRCCWQ